MGSTTDIPAKTTLLLAIETTIINILNLQFFWKKESICLNLNACQFGYIPTIKMYRTKL